MEQTLDGNRFAAEEHAKQHLTLEEKLQKLEEKEQKAHEAETRRKAKIAKLRAAVIAKKRETFDKVLAANGIETETALRETMALYTMLKEHDICNTDRLAEVLEAATRDNRNFVERQM